MLLQHLTVSGGQRENSNNKLDTASPYQDSLLSKYERRIQDYTNRMAQTLRSLAALSGPEFKSQHTHSGSQPTVMRSGALLWPAGIHAGRTMNA